MRLRQSHDFDREARAWARFKLEHEAELPPPAPHGTPEGRERQRLLGKLYMQFLESRGNPFTRLKKSSGTADND